jgi:hypothetical protein
MNELPTFRSLGQRTIRRALEWISIVALVAISFRNIRSFERDVQALPQPQSDELVVQEERYGPIRAILKEAGYTRGPIAFITNRDLTTGERIEEDDRRWGQGQYAMIPWTLLRKGRSVAGPLVSDVVPMYTIADFWDGKPPRLPEGLEPVHDSGSGLVLFRTVTP